MNFDSNTLLASLVWGSVGSGFAAYGWKQKKMLPLFGGLALIGVSYFISSALAMSLVSLALIALIYLLRGRV